jgi:hypothetical protein
MKEITGSEACPNEYEVLVDKKTRDFVAAFVERARAEIERLGSVPNTLHVGKIGSAENFAPEFEKVSKATASEMTRARAKEVNADFILYVDEHWAIYPKTIDEGLALRRKYGAVEKMPGRVRIVRIQIETRAGHFVAEARRVRVFEGVECYTFSKVDFVYCPHAQGIFMGLLPR